MHDEEEVEHPGPEELEDEFRGEEAGDEGGAPEAPPRPELEPLEARVLGVLIEKAYSTPQQYPLSLNALTNGANQKSNRDPVLDVEEPEVHDAVEGLRQKGLASMVQMSGSRVDKYRHRARDVLAVEGASLAILAELLMRGPQMPGELRTRASRMVKVASLEELQATLDDLAERGLVEKHPPARGSRAPRYAQLLCPGLHPIEAGDESAAAPSRSAGRAAAPATAPAADPDLVRRVEALEAEVRRLAEEVAELRGAS